VLKLFADLTKFGIVVFSVLAGLAGYATGFQNEDSFDWKIFLKVIIGIYFLSSGCLALNQVQDAKLDAKMPRTMLRPIPSGKIKPAAAAILAVLFTLVGLQMLFEVQVVAGWVGLLSVFLYNGPYTLYLKRKWAYAAVPGAIPGALPVTIGYAAANRDSVNSESIYLFLIMFLWQMPHFWVLAIRYKDDYAAGGIPTLPVAKGLDVTLYQIVMYTFAYVGVALAAPLFVHVNWLYILLTLPLVFKIIQELVRYYKSKGEQRWLAFFMWLNVSMLIFILIPVIDKWNFLFLGRG
jgi:protoheme IX farnesyltransferase